MRKENLEMKNCSFVSVLTTDDYLEGLLVLKYSLEQTCPKYPFVLLVTPNLSPKTIETLTKHNINLIPIQGIEGPKAVTDPLLKRWNYTYSKLAIFGLTQFDKIVYLDADMLVLRNIDDLFEKPHMSAVKIRGKLPELSTWNQLNSGLLVVEPSVQVFNDMLSKIGAIEKVEASSDEDFLNAYYEDWPNQEELHLDSTYNIFQYYWHRYNQLYGYSFIANKKPIKIVHYIGEEKPWRLYQIYKKTALPEAIKQFLRRFKHRELRLLHQVNRLWFKSYQELYRNSGESVDMGLGCKILVN